MTSFPGHADVGEHQNDVRSCLQKPNCLLGIAGLERLVAGMDDEVGGSHPDDGVVFDDRMTALRSAVMSPPRPGSSFALGNGCPASADFGVVIWLCCRRHVVDDVGNVSDRYDGSRLSVGTLMSLFRFLASASTIPVPSPAFAALSPMPIPSSLTDRVLSCPCER